MAELNELIHQPARLRIMAALTAHQPGAALEFTHLRDLLGLTDGNLGAHLRRLEEAGYVRLTKTFVGRKPRTYIEATERGRRAFEAHVAALQEILSSGGEEHADREA